MRAILIDKADEEYSAALTDVDEAGLPEGDVDVRVDYSTMNYKDSLAITGSSPIVRSFPMVPGIDLAGEVTASRSERFSVGDRVLVNGYGVGESHWGGLAERARLRSEWLIPIPEPFDARQAMVIGTAGYTAMLCVMALERNGVEPGSGEVLVTGAAGGVGSVAVSLLSSLGYEVVASTGRADQRDYLLGLGAADTIDRGEFSEQGRPMGRERWAGAVDVAGSHTLANVVASTRYGGAVAACGLAQGYDLPATVMPFILRNVTLAGVDSVNCPMERRLEAWSRLATDLDIAKLEQMSETVGLDRCLEIAPQQLAGQVRGRIVVDVNP